MALSFKKKNPRTVAVAASWLVDSSDSNSNVQALLLRLTGCLFSRHKIISWVFILELFYTLLAEHAEVDHLLFPLQWKISGKKWDS